MIRSERSVAAPAAVVHAVLTDVRAWRLWSPHIARVDAPEQVIEAAGWSGLVKPWFGPATRMDVTWCEPGRGIRWASTAGGYRLEYADLIEPAGDGCTVTMTARLDGPAGGLLERGVAPLSAYGQRRRLERLALLAEYVHGRTPAPHALSARGAAVRSPSAAGGSDDLDAAQAADVTRYTS